RARQDQHTQQPRPDTTPISFSRSADPLVLHSFPTRRSSDLEFLPWPHLLTYLEAILRVYNRYGRRDNIHKAREKILVKERGPERDRKSTRLNSSHRTISYAVFCLKKKSRITTRRT